MSFTLGSRVYVLLIYLRVLVAGAFSFQASYTLQKSSDFP